VQLQVLQQYDSFEVDDYAVRQLRAEKKQPGVTGLLVSDCARVG
jgi:hypothetical protein